MINTKDEFVGEYFYNEEDNIVGLAICATCGFEKLIVLDEHTIDLIEINTEDMQVLDTHVKKYKEFKEAPDGICRCEDSRYILVKVVDKDSSELSVDYRWLNVESKSHSRCLQHTRPKDREVSYFKQTNQIEVRCYLCGRCVISNV